MIAQIQSLKQQMGMGQYAQQTQGQANSSWGFGTNPNKVAPAPADGANQIENRQNSETRDGEITDYEGLYAPEDYAHGFGDEDHLKGNIDFRYDPKKIEEIRSAPETQEALTEYSNIVGAYVEGEESAISREKVPLEYQEEVRKYFDQVQKDEGSTDEAEGEEPEEPAEDDSEED